MCLGRKESKILSQELLNNQLIRAYLRLYLSCSKLKREKYENKMVKLDKNIGKKRGCYVYNVVFEVEKILKSLKFA